METSPASSKTQSISNGVVFSFTDSGAPPNSTDYTTVLLLHGAGFNGYIFNKLHSYAHSFNLRTIALNRRDYAGSTPLTSAELVAMSSGQKSFLDDLRAELVEFLKEFIEKERIPPIALDKNSGGLAIVGWSLGAQIVLSLISDAEDAFVEQYLKSIILFDPPYTTFGYTLPLDTTNYVPWLDPANDTLDAMLQSYVTWTCSYFDHGRLTSDAKSRPSIHDLDKRNKGEKVTVLTEDDLEKCMELRPLMREAAMTSPPMQSGFSHLAQQILFPETPSARAATKVPITYLGTSQTIWISAWAEIETKRRYAEYRNKMKDSGKVIRFVRMDGENHFVHWDQPKAFLETLVNIVCT
ncbi:Alpha/Beta hydrolase protein [Rhodocollybia butyracea]|uniref:Alpha/Beta hydrolase protein n=1 Tax=Rhodocollybia butyracea TaxID=206335 RepID=A0A9P5Q152_9AGAR|nr:Alpha/Beta hydrolase protein [Rhodocollybia butyracea]